MSFAKDLFTCADGESYDIGRVSWAVSTAVIIAAAAWNAWRGAPINLTELAGALGGVVVAHGAALWAKAVTEPKP
ncbi:hypothetical protein [Duganella callida]|uniref:Uncharacterized protein n=1 Tax=Duganella callida TaxID=2561932 RepID=A0A4Y9S3P8_9BURK|nr:hypothetical protein [Duganella callida]TFW15978.1 hypothetical protein E4L98_25120 [Duganella callida]